MQAHSASGESLRPKSAAAAVQGWQKEMDQSACDNTPAAPAHWSPRSRIKSDVMSAGGDSFETLAQKARGRV